MHIGFSCTYRVYELIKFIKKTKKHTYSFDHTSFMYKILSSNFYEPMSSKKDKIFDRFELINILKILFCYS
jgi:hypothetical protein